jgi:hypothetical protein
MPRATKVKAEIIRVSPETAMPDLATLDLLIQKRVAEATANQGAILEPWFQSPTVAAEIRRHQSIFHKRKFALYFEKWGCLVCGTKKKDHVSHGMCQTCHGRFVDRLKLLEKEYAKAHPQEYENQQIENLTTRLRSAQRILGIVRQVTETPETEEEQKL